MSIKVCVIAPASHVNLYSNLGDCEMVLSHLVVEDAGFNHTEHVRNNYVKYYKQKTAEGKWTILDNSAYEIGKLEATSASGRGLGPDIVLKAAEIINPSIVIAQDILTDRDETYRATKDFINYVKGKGLLGKFQIMAVAQGKTEDEWFDSYIELSLLPEVNQIGFSKIAVPLCFGGNQATAGCVSQARLRCTKKVDELNDNIRYMWSLDKIGLSRLKPVHLLGGDNWLPWELNQQKQYPWIFSNDSSAVVWYGAHGKTYDPTDGKIDNIITQKPDLENNHFETETKLSSSEGVTCILYNISVLHKFSK